MKKLGILFILALVCSINSAQYRDVKLPQAPKRPAYKDFSQEATHFWFAIDLDGGSTVMAVQPNMQFVNLNYTMGYRFSEYIRVGVGLGARCYVHNADVRGTDSRWGIPVFLNARGNFISTVDRDGVPYWSMNVGGITNEGVYVSPTIGYSFGGIRNNFQIGITYTLTSFNNFMSENKVYSAFGLRLGYEY